MKKTIALICLLLAAVFVVSSCSHRLIDTDSPKQDDFMSFFLDTIEKEDKEGFKALFSEKVIEESEDFDSDVNLFFEYYEKGLISKKEFGSGTRKTISKGKKLLEYDFSFDITTESGIFRFSILYNQINTFESNNVGITSLYVYKYNEEDDNISQAYRGYSENYTPGIHIDVKNLPVRDDVLTT
ncbi:MAG: DUF5104 domain-containing protein [Clostridia bacterium]|nr:DUF5104 domain-containing protein [Clostridia bacterium]